MNRVVEIRTYTLKAGTHVEFARLFREQAESLLLRWGIDVVGFAPSLQDKNVFCLVRSYANLAERQQMEEDFYGSNEWQQGPRQAILGCIESYSEVVLWLDEETIKGLRCGLRSV